MVFTNMMHGTKIKLTERIAFDGILACLSLIAFTIESLLPPVLLPGAKIGLANIFTLLSLYWFGPLDGLAVLMVRVIIGSMFSSAGQIVYSLPAGLASLAVSIILVRFARNAFSPLSISCAAGVIHNLVQTGLYCCINNAPEMLLYMPYLGLIGMGSGIFTGLIVYFILKKTKFLNRGEKKN